MTQGSMIRLRLQSDR